MRLFTLILVAIAALYFGIWKPAMDEMEELEPICAEEGKTVFFDHDTGEYKCH